MDPRYDHLTDELEPCLCGFKPDHYSIYYGRTPYNIHCPVCQKYTHDGKCLVTGHQSNIIDYWNKKISKMTKEEIREEVRLFEIERKEAESVEGMRAKEYRYYWEKDTGEKLYQRW